MYDSQDQRAAKQQLEEAKQLFLEQWPGGSPTSDSLIAIAQIIATNAVARMIGNLPS